jgi:hypothetical protein
MEYFQRSTHRLILDGGKGEIARGMQLVAGRKRRLGGIEL